jgi:hypothetical protein
MKMAIVVRNHDRDFSLVGDVEGIVSEGDSFRVSCDVRRLRSGPGNTKNETLVLWVKSGYIARLEDCSIIFKSEPGSDGREMLCFTRKSEDGSEDVVILGPR